MKKVGFEPRRSRFLRGRGASPRFEALRRPDLAPTSLRHHEKHGLTLSERRHSASRAYVAPHHGKHLRSCRFGGRCPRSTRLCCTVDASVSRPRAERAGQFRATRFHACGSPPGSRIALRGDISLPCPCPFCSRLSFACEATFLHDWREETPSSLRTRRTRRNQRVCTLARVRAVSLLCRLISVPLHLRFPRKLHNLQVLQVER